MEQKKYFDILQIYRGIAALLVVIHHTYASFGHFHHFDFPFLAFIAKTGKLGVDFFFVLSGFIIAYTTYEYRDDPQYLKKYFIARLTRIYIPYLPISIGLLCLYTLFPSFSESGRSISILTSLTLFPYGNPALSVAWTLVFEMLFYLVYALNFISRKWWFTFLGFWLLSILSASFFDFSSGIPLLDHFINLYNLEFLSGVLVAYLVKNNWKPSYKILFSTALIVLVMFLIIKYFEISFFNFSQNLIFTVCAGLFVFLGIGYWNKKINKRNFFMLIGNSSYSLYLLHNPLQSLLVRIFPKINQQIFIFAEFLVVVLIICIISYIYYFIFEKIIMNWTKQKINFKSA